MRRIALNIALLAVTSLLTLGVAEAGARHAYRAPWYMRLLGDQVRNQKLPYHLHRWGLRGVDYPPKESGATRVFLIGDSFTFGLGVREDPLVMPAILERSIGVEVLNGGLSGSHTRDWVELLERVGPEFEPDIVTAVFFLRDGTLIDAMGSFFRPIRDKVARRNENSRLYRHVYLYRLWRDAVDRRRVGAMYASALVRAYAGDSTETREWQAAQRNLLTMKALAAKRHAKFAMIVYPVLADLEGPYPFQEICDTLVAFAQRNAIPVHNLLDDFRGQQGPDLWVSAFDQHPNQKAHAIAAHGIEPFVRRLIGQTPMAGGRAGDVPDTGRYRVRD